MGKNDDSGSISLVTERSLTPSGLAAQPSIEIIRGGLKDRVASRHIRQDGRVYSGFAHLLGLQPCRSFLAV